MAAFNFPNSPSVNDIHTENGVSWKWNGVIWNRVAGVADKIEEDNSKVEVIDTGSNGVVKVEIDGSETYRFSDGSLNFKSGTSVRMTGISGGTASGLHIDSAGGNGRLAVFGSSGNLQILDSTNSGDTNMGVFNKNSSVDLYFDGTKRFETASSGINVVGTTTTGQLSVTGVSTFTGTVNVNGDISIADKIIHAGDTDTKIRFPGADTIQLETGGSNRLKIDANGVVQVTRRLELTNSGDNHAVYEGRAWTWTSNGTSGGTVRGYVLADGSSNLKLGTNGWNEKLRITSTGNIGINTVNPGDYDPGAESLVICGPGGTLGQSGITIVSGSDKYGCLYFGDGTGSSSYRGRIEYSHGNDNLLMGAGGAHGDLTLDANGDMFLRGDSTCYIVLGSAGDATTGGANNSMNWIRGNGNNLLHNCAGGFHAWENSGSEKMKLNGDHLELTGASQCKITMGSAGTAGTNDSNWIRGDGNRLMFNCATTGGDHTWEIAGTAYAKINTDFGLKADNTCKAWLCYRSEAGNEGIQDDFGVASVTDESTGSFWINLDNNIHRHGNGFYQSIVFGSYNASPYPIIAAIGYAPSHGSNNPWWDVEDNGCRVNTQRSDTGAILDAKVFSVAMFGDTGDLSPT